MVDMQNFLCVKIVQRKKKNQTIFSVDNNTH